MPVPVIASGGVGNINHFVELFKNTPAEAALAATVFHDKMLTIMELKENLAEQNIPVRLVE